MLLFVVRRDLFVAVRCYFFVVVRSWLFVVVVCLCLMSVDGVCCLLLFCGLFVVCLVFVERRCSMSVFDMCWVLFA